MTAPSRIDVRGQLQRQRQAGQQPGHDLGEEGDIHHDLPTPRMLMRSARRKSMPVAAAMTKYSAAAAM